MAAIAEKYHSQGHKVYYPKKSYAPVDILIKSCFDAIDDADIVLVFYDKIRGIGTGVSYEIEYARRKNKHIRYECV